MFADKCVKYCSSLQIFPYRQLKVDNYRSPRGVDKTNLEVKLRLMRHQNISDLVWGFMGPSYEWFKVNVR